MKIELRRETTEIHNDTVIIDRIKSRGESAEEEDKMIGDREYNEVKESLYTAIDVMSTENAEKLWGIVYSEFNEAAKWALIPEEEPDEWDLEMLEAIKNDPDCNVFVPAEEVERLLLGSPVNERKTA